MDMKISLEVRASGDILQHGYSADTPQKSGFTEFKVLGVYLSPPQAGKIYNTQVYHISAGVLK